MKRKPNRELVIRDKEAEYIFNIHLRDITSICLTEGEHIYVHFKGGVISADIDKCQLCDSTYELNIGEKDPIKYNAERFYEALCQERTKKSINSRFWVNLIPMTGLCPLMSNYFLHFSK